MESGKHKTQAVALVAALTVAGCNGLDVAKPGETLKFRRACRPALSV